VKVKGTKNARKIFWFFTFDIGRSVQHASIQIQLAYPISAEP